MQILDCLPSSYVAQHGEDSEAYKITTNRIIESVDPKDYIELLWIRDIADLLWQILRLRRLKSNVLKLASEEGLKDALGAIIGRGRSDELIDKWALGDQAARKELNDLLETFHISFDNALANGMLTKITEIERIDRMIASAESRRNAVLREISRHRDALAIALGRASAAIEDAEFAEVQETNEHGLDPLA